MSDRSMISMEEDFRRVFGDIHHPQCSPPCMCDLHECQRRVGVYLTAACEVLGITSEETARTAAVRRNEPLVGEYEKLARSALFPRPWKLGGDA